MKLSKNSKIRLIGQISLKERKFEFIFETDISGKLKWHSAVIPEQEPC